MYKVNRAVLIALALTLFLPILSLAQSGSILEGVQVASMSQPFDRNDLPPLGLVYRENARQRGRSVDEHGAGTAVTLVTPLFRTGQAEAVSQRFGQRVVCRHADLHGVTVDPQRHDLVGWRHERPS